MVFQSISPTPSRLNFSASTSPSLRYSISIRSSRSKSRFYRSYTHRNSRDPSLECLLSPANKRTRLESQGSRNSRMTGSDGNGVDIERRISYGIGGAGNIRRPSEVMYPSRTNADGRRRSSVWSSLTPSPGTSPEGKRVAIFNFFKKGAHAQAASGKEAEGNSGVVFNKVDLGGKRNVELE